MMWLDLIPYTAAWITVGLVLFFIYLLDGQFHDVGEDSRWDAVLNFAFLVGLFGLFWPIVVYTEVRDNKR